MKMKFGYAISSALVVLLVSDVNGMFDKKKAAEAKNNPMVSMVIGILGKDCEDLYDKCMEKVDKVYHPMWDWLIGSCNKDCGKEAEMQEAVKYLNYGLQFADRLFLFLKKSSVNFDIWGLCPRLVSKAVYVDYIDKIKKNCLDKKPHGYNVMHAKDLCHLTSTQSFNKTGDCIKDLIISDVTAKIMPPPMDCVGNVKKYCAKKHHPVILGWIDFMMVDLLKAKTAPKNMKDKSGNGLEAEWNAFAVIHNFFNSKPKKCKADNKFAGKYEMVTA